MTAPKAVSGPAAPLAGSDTLSLQRENDLLRSALVVARRDHKRAQDRTFELSEQIERVRADAEPLRSLLGEVILHCIPTTDCYRLEPDNLWYRARRVADGGAA